MEFEPMLTPRENKWSLNHLVDKHAKVFYAVGKTTIISLNWTNFMLEEYEGIEFDLLQHIKLHPNQLRSKQGNEANKFCFPFTLWP